jgi:hypothetical protein
MRFRPREMKIHPRIASGSGSRILPAAESDPFAQI